MQPANQSAAIQESSRANGHSAAQDLFVLTDEQILEIEPDAQDATVSDARDRTNPPDAFDEILGGTKNSSPRSGNGATPGAAVRANGESAEQAKREAPAADLNAQQNIAKNAQDGTPVHDQPVLREPPSWLAAQMKDPWNGADARELWEGTQRAEREAAAYREVFAKPEEAKAAADRARTLDDIDRAYFAGDALQRSQLAAMMLREDPAAFREMVFEGLRALESAGSPGSNRSVADALARVYGNTSAAASRTALGQTQNAASVTAAENSAETSQHSAPLQKRDDSAQQAQLAAYAGFEKSANDDLERSVGRAIERTLTQALPALANAHDGSSAGPQHVAPLQARLTEAIRQDVEKALQGDRQLGEQVAQLLASRRFDSETRAQVVRLISERALQIVPGAAKRALKDWTQTTLAAHRTRNGRAEFAGYAEVPLTAGQNASRGAASGAAPQTTRGAPARSVASSSRVDYRKLSDDQIMDL